MGVMDGYEEDEKRRKRLENRLILENNLPEEESFLKCAGFAKGEKLFAEKTTKASTPYFALLFYPF